MSMNWRKKKWEGTDKTILCLGSMTINLQTNDPFYIEDVEHKHDFDKRIIGMTWNRLGSGLKPLKKSANVVSSLMWTGADIMPKERRIVDIN